MHATMQDLPLEMQIGDDLAAHGTEWGDTSVRALRLPAGTDLRPLLAGLPGDRCACPHWGYVVDGSMTVRYEDGTEETTSAGELFYWPGGHTGWTDDGVTFVEFSPAAEIAPVLAHLAAKVAAAG